MHVWCAWTWDSSRCFLWVLESPFSKLIPILFLVTIRNMTFEVKTAKRKVQRQESRICRFSSAFLIGFSSEIWFVNCTKELWKKEDGAAKMKESFFTTDEFCAWWDCWNVVSEDSESRVLHRNESQKENFLIWLPRRNSPVLGFHKQLPFFNPFFFIHSACRLHGHCSR